VCEVAGRNYNSCHLQFPRKNDIGSSLIPCFVGVHVSFMFFVFESGDGCTSGAGIADPSRAPDFTSDY
jgi:hypothetical protein